MKVMVEKNAAVDPKNLVITINMMEAADREECCRCLYSRKVIVC